MHKTLHPMGPVQNLGLLDRAVRLIVGGAMLAVVAFDGASGTVLGWHAYVAIISIYPLMTGFVGWDPLYSLGHVKSCDLSDRNRCGTLPFSVMAAMGHKHKCHNGYDCSLTPDDKK